ncbi:hypothetical protein HDU97_004008 [Phlyctochytrium planicorne]|nr:hypothetical protein HDU97_004008 [Phlyctochytrium planicorne]
MSTISSEDTTRKVSQKEAIRLMEAEQLRRLDEFYKDELTGHSERQKQTELAIKAAEEERTRRIQEENKAASQAAFLRRSSLKTAVDLMENERVRRMSSRSIENLSEENKNIKKELQAVRQMFEIVCNRLKAFIDAVNKAPPSASRRYSTITDETRNFRASVNSTNAN